MSRFFYGIEKSGICAVRTAQPDIYFCSPNGSGAKEMFRMQTLTEKPEVDMIVRDEFAIIS